MSLSQILWPTTIVNVAFLKVFFKLLAKFFKIKLSAEFFFSFLAWKMLLPTIENLTEIWFQQRGAVSV